MRADDLRAAGIPVFELPLRSLTNRTTVEAFRVLRRYLREHNIRLVHCFDAAMSVFAVPVARLSGTPAVFSSQRCYRDLIARKYHPLLRLAHSMANGVVGNCEAMRAHLRADYGVPDDKIRVCYNAIDSSIFHDRGRARMPALQSAPLVIGTIGLLRPEKRLPLLLDAFAAVSSIDRSMKLVIVGDGAELPQLKNRAAALGIAEACVFQPATPQVAAWFRSIDIYVLGSSSEAFSNALLEAIACGCCPVASRVGGNLEIVKHGETGLLFNTDDAKDLAAQLEILIRDPGLRSHLAAAATETVRTRFSHAAAIRCMEAVYRDALS